MTSIILSLLFFQITLFFLSFTSTYALALVQKKKLKKNQPLCHYHSIITKSNFHITEALRSNIGIHFFTSSFL